MPPIEEYLEHADKLALGVEEDWALRKQTGIVPNDPERDALVEKACSYRAAREIADSRRQLSTLSERDAAYEQSTRQAFVESYKAYHEKCVEKSNQASA